MIDVKRAADSLSGLSLLKFFPSDPAARAELVSLACEMATTNEQIDWLSKRCRNLWSQWEGPKEFRAIFCSKFKPADGIECYSDLPQFLDGIPSEKPAAPQLAAPERKQITAAATISAAPSLAATVRDLAVSKDLNRAVKSLPPPKVAEIPVVRITEANRITTADIEREVQRLRDKRAAEEIEGVA